jgi:prevent-host-death family protein
MRDIPIRVLNQETARVLARVKAGEEIIVTERGAVIARIVPASAGPLDDLVSAGRVLPATTHGNAPRPTIPMENGPDAGALLSQMRETERH